MRRGRAREAYKQARQTSVDKALKKAGLPTGEVEGGAGAVRRAIRNAMAQARERRSGK